jgi:hypothetical protein
MSVRVLVFGRRQRRDAPQAQLAGVQKAPRLEDRDLIRGGHYGQRRKQAEHMAAPTNAVK